MANSRAFVIKSIKSGETSMIVSCYLEDIGYKSFMVKGILGTKKSKFSKAHFFPMNFINLNYSYSESKNFGFIKEVKSEKLYNSLHVDIQKSSVIIFISEILNNIFKEDIGTNKKLFYFLKSSLSWYDDVDSCNNFHIKFLLELTKYIGFYPNIKNDKDLFFNINDGTSSISKPNGLIIRDEEFKIFKLFLGTKFEDLNMIKVNNKFRVKILKFIIDYYSIHLQMFKPPKSINVLSEIFK